MLTAFSTSEHATLHDANRLVHIWDVSSNNCHRLRYQPQQGIEIHGDDQQSYLEDLLALSVHCEDLAEVVKKALQAIPKTASSLQSFYNISQQYQGLRVLLHKITAAIYPKSEILIQNALNNPPLPISDSFVQVVIELRNNLNSLNHCRLLAAASHKLFLYDTMYIFGIVTNEENELQTSFMSPYLSGKEFTVATVQVEDNLFELKGRVDANFAAHYQPTLLPALTNMTRFKLMNADGGVAVEMSVYPKWTNDIRGCLMTLPQFQQCPHGAHDYVRSLTEQHSSGVLTYQPPCLAAVLNGPFASAENSDVLPLYFQAMVEIAKNHHCYQVELFIPYDFMPYAYAFGFYSEEKGEQELCEQIVKLSSTHKRRVSLKHEIVNRFEGGDELLLPVYFPLDELNTREVHFTEQGVKTTYGEICRQQSLFKDASPNSILPDPYGLLARPFLSIYQAINKQKIDGKPIPRTVSSYQKELTDTRWLTKQCDLQSIGEASHIKPHQINKTVRISR